MKNSTLRIGDIKRFSARGLALALALAAGWTLPAATVIWNASSYPDTNWSTGGNWTGGTGTAGVPGPTDDVVFNATGAVVSSIAVSNAVDSTGGNFGGTIYSLQYTNNVNNSFQNTLIAPGVTLNITNNTGPFGSALFVGSPTAAAANLTMVATISGTGATLNVNNTNAVISLSQSGGSGALGTLNMTNLDNFSANIKSIAIGDFLYGVGTIAAQGSLFLARTNAITTSWVGSHASPYSTGNQPTNAIHIGVGSSSTLGGINALFLGLTNAIFTDSITVGGVKSGGSAAAPCRMAFAPVFTNSSPSLYLRGVNGANSRVFLWGVGDTAINSGSSAQAFGNVDLSNGSIDALVDNLIVGRDRNGTAPLIGGVFTFTAGNLDVNALIAGDQGSANTGSAVSGAMTVNGPNATLTVNVLLELGHTTLTGGPANALNTRGVLNIFNGRVNANAIAVGASSITNILAMNNATLNVSTAVATNASGVFSLTMTNSTLALTIGDASLKALAGTLTTGGATNVIVLSSVPVFGSYPLQFPLIKYTNAAIAGVGFNFGLSNTPVAAPGASLVNNTANKSIDLLLPVSPAPVITSQPQPFAGNTNDTVVFSVTNTGNPTLVYQWYYTNGVSTIALSDGPGPSGGSTLSGTATAVLTIATAQPGDNGGYFVVITNDFGSATSVIVQLNIGTPGPPVITGPTDQTVIQGNTATFTAAVAANPFATIQWQTGGTNIPGATAPTLVVPNVQYPANDQEVFSIIASNSFASVTNSATLTVIVPPTISVQPARTNVLNGQTATFSVTAGGVPAVSYQWAKNGSPITGANSSTLSFATAIPSDAAIYSVTITNTAGSVVSSNAVLIVNSTMAVTSLFPANGATGVCVDAPLKITFDTAPTIGSGGRVRIFNATNTTTPVDTIDLGLSSIAGVQPRTVAGTPYNAYPVIISGNTANVYPHAGVLATNQTYYVTVENVIGGTFKDAAGATFIGITDTNAWRFTTKAGGPANPTNIVVAADGSGDFDTVQGAVDFVPAANAIARTINIRNGVYTEIVYVNSRTNLTFIGQNRDQSIITYANNDNLNGGTSGRPSFRLQGSDNALVNLTLTNSTPKGGSQAEALRTDGRRIIILGVKLASYQDTMLNNNNGDLVYVQDSLIQGDTDFIWGGGTTFLTNSEIRTLSSGTQITQARTTAGTNGFSFVGCMITRSSAGVTGCGLGRDLGFTDNNVGFTYCLIDAHITGWLNADARDWESGNSNITGTASVAYNGVQLTVGDARLTLATNAVAWLYGWIPQFPPLIISQPTSQSVAGGATTQFSAAALGIDNPTYQWLKNGTNLNGQTSATLTINNANVNDAGSYSVVITNSAGSATSVTVSLTVGNTAPTLTPVSDQTVNVGVTVNVTNGATDPDVPIQSLTFSMLAGPGGVDAGTGVFTWRPDVTFSGTTNGVQVVVTDNGAPNLSATNSFSVIVNPLTAPSVSSYSIAGGQFALSVSGIAGPDYALQISTNLSDWDTLLITNSPPPVFTLVDTNTISTIPMRFYRIKTGPPLP